MEISYPQKFPLIFFNSFPIFLKIQPLKMTPTGYPNKKDKRLLLSTRLYSTTKTSQHRRKKQSLIQIKKNILTLTNRFTRLSVLANGDVNLH